MAEFYLVRHGQASFGTEDYDRLSVLGEQQSIWLGQYFSERAIQFDRVIIGTQLRHRQTADGIFRGLGQRANYTEHAGLNEYDFYGLYNLWRSAYADFQPLASIEKREFYKGLKQALLSWSEGKLAGKLPESWSNFAQRAGEARNFIQNCGGRKILVVSSGGPIGMMCNQILESSARIAIELNFQIRNASFSHCYFNEKTIQLASFNNVPHLDRYGRFDAITYG